MANLTLAIDDALLRRARIRALEQGTSVNAIVRAFLERYADLDGRDAAIRTFLDIASGSDAGSKGGGRSWTRDGLYDERTSR